MTENQAPPSPNPLGSASLWMGIVSILFVFGIGLCAMVGLKQGWILKIGGTLLFVCGASSAFLGLIGAFLGFGGLFGARKPRSAAIAGMLLGLGGLCLFLSVLSWIQKGG
jgi:hypothetical protein